MMKSTSFETGSTLVRISHIPIEDGEPFGELIEISANLKCKNHTCMQVGFLTDLYNGEFDSIEYKNRKLNLQKIDFDSTYFPGIITLMYTLEQTKEESPSAALRSTYADFAEFYRIFKPFEH